LIVVAADHPDWFSRLHLSAAVVSFFIGMGSIGVSAFFAVLILWPRPFIGTSFKNEARDISGDATEVVSNFEGLYAAEIALLQAWEKNELSLAQKTAGLRPLAFFIGTAIISLTVSAISLVGEGIHSAVKEPTPRRVEEPLHNVQDCVGASDNNKPAKPSALSNSKTTQLPPPRPKAKK